jgi:hypothetical protein
LFPQCFGLRNNPARLYYQQQFLVTGVEVSPCGNEPGSLVA